MGRTNIEWSEITWNPTTGCTKISAGCKNCYAEKWAIMQQRRGIDQYKNGFSFSLAKNRLNVPLTWTGQKLVFVNSMSDLFHEDIPSEYLEEIFSVMNRTPQHNYQILTKRVHNVEIFNKLKWTSNIWLGVSVENNEALTRIDLLKNTLAKVKFISFEPLLENITHLDLNGIDWVIVGGESGGKARSIDETWIISIKTQCRDLGIPFFFKQWGKRQFNPNKADPTIHKSHIHHARGGCLIQNQLFKELPTSSFGIPC